MKYFVLHPWKPAAKLNAAIVNYAWDHTQPRQALPLLRMVTVHHTSIKKGFNMLTQKEKQFTGLTDQQKIDIKKMFNEYLNQYSQLMEYREAVIYAQHKTRQNISIMLDTYKGAR